MALNCPQCGATVPAALVKKQMPFPPTQSKATSKAAPKPAAKPAAKSPAKKTAAEKGAVPPGLAKYMAGKKKGK
jgi:hypothetical protein